MTITGENKKLSRFCGQDYTKLSMGHCLYLGWDMVPVNNFSVISRQSKCFLGINRYSGELSCLAQGYNKVP